MKILLLNALYHPRELGGAERSTRLLAEGLHDRGHDVTVACLGPEEETERWEVNGVQVRGLPLHNVYWLYDDEEHPILKPFAHVLNTYNPLMKREVGKVLEEVKPDVVHTHTLSGFSPAIWKTTKEHEISLVHTLREYSLLCPRNMRKRGHTCDTICWTCRPCAAPRRRLSNHVDAVAGVSRFTLDRHLDMGYFEDSKKEVVYNAYDPPNEVTPPSKIYSGEPRLGYLGGLNKRKGFGWLLKTLYEAEETWDLYIGGRTGSDYVRRLREKYETEHTHFLGYVDPASFFERIDILVVPSLWPEPFGRIVIEAYAHGVPVMAASRGGLREIVIDGKTGWLYDPERPSTLTDRISCIEEEKWKKLSKESIQESNKYRIDNHVQKYVSIYKKLYKDG